MAELNTPRPGKGKRGKIDVHDESLKRSLLASANSRQHQWDRTQPHTARQPDNPTGREPSHKKRTNTTRDAHIKRLPTKRPHFLPPMQQDKQQHLRSRTMVHFNSETKARVNDQYALLGRSFPEHPTQLERRRQHGRRATEPHNVAIAAALEQGSLPLVHVRQSRVGRPDLARAEGGTSKQTFREGSRITSKSWAESMLRDGPSTLSKNDDGGYDEIDTSLAVGMSPMKSLEKFRPPVEPSISKYDMLQIEHDRCVTDDDAMFDVERQQLYSVLTNVPTHPTPYPGRASIVANSAVAQFTATPRGGVFVLQASGISVMVPPGAVDSPTQLSVGLCMNKSLLAAAGELGGFTLLSPGIMWLEPHGCEFREPIAISVPHNLILPKKNSNGSAGGVTAVVAPESVRVLYSGTALDAAPRWEEITTTTEVAALYGRASTHRDKQALLRGVVVGEHAVTLLAQSLCLYAVVAGARPGASGRLLVKEVAAVLLAETVARRAVGDVVRLKVHLVDNLPADRQRVMSESGPGCRLLGQQPLLLYDNGKRVTVSLLDIDDDSDWKVLTKRNQVAGFRKVWHNMGPACEFLLQQTSRTSDVLVGHVAACQDGADPDDDGAQIAVCYQTLPANSSTKTSNKLGPSSLQQTNHHTRKSDHLPANQPDATDMVAVPYNTDKDVPPVRHTDAVLDYLSGSGGEVTTRLPNLPHTARMELSLLLDPDSRRGNDWRMLADVLGVSRYIGYFRSLPMYGQSPTAALLTLWELTGRPSEQLTTVLREMGREDAATMLTDTLNSGAKAATRPEQ